LDDDQNHACAEICTAAEQLKLVIDSGCRAILGRFFWMALWGCGFWVAQRLQRCDI
jgi:hypothetical protein